MKTAKKKSAPKTNVKKKSSSKSADQYGMKESVLMKLFHDELKDIYWAEKTLTKALPKMIKNATSPELLKLLKTHLKETVTQVKKVEKVFSIIGKKPQAKKCEAMAGLVKEADGIIKDTKAGAMRDAGIISAAQKVEHYEIASYGTLKTFANTLGLSTAASILEEILNEEKNADHLLSGVSESTINIMAAKESAS